ncbi:MAG: hypothetical protein RJA44_166, partial [Pseudomonadota bacterium]
QRSGYRGARRTIMVVDNEEADRGFVASVLEPLGFRVRQAANGEDCLAQLEALQDGRDDAPLPDAIFMDLAMPGLDGWATLRQLRAEALSHAPAAIISANAFDKGLDNDVGITPADFLVKPVRVAELLDWLGRRLELDWIETGRNELSAAPTAPVMPLVYPAPAQLQALLDAAELGYPRGVLKLLDQLEAERPECRDFSARLRQLARQFQFDAMSGLLRQALHEHRPA